MSEASELEHKYPAHLRSLFAIPTFDSTGLRTGDHSPVTYLCGNSLGLMPLGARDRCRDEVEAWANLGVMGHHKRRDGRDPWITNDEPVAGRLARLVFGCRPSEVAFAGTLTANLSALFQAFYRPAGRRYKVMCEAKAFPSDLYCFQNQIELQGHTVADALVLVAPREGELVIRTEDVLEAIRAHGDELAVVCFSGVQFYTGQYFDIPAITAAAHAAGAVAGWDLAHAAGNVELRLHDWNVDFAVFCSYKYLNCGAGNVGGFFVHDDFAARHQRDPRPAGWWAVDLKTRFDMEFQFEPAAGARGYLQSNCALFGPACMNASLDVFEIAGGVSGLAPRQKALTGYLTRVLQTSPHYGKKFRIMTDELPEAETGAQVSILFLVPMRDTAARLEAKGVIGDARKPSVMRLTPAPLYTTFAEVWNAAQALEEILNTL